MNPKFQGPQPPRPSLEEARRLVREYDQRRAEMKAESIAQTTWTVPCLVTRVVDGDTLKGKLDLGFHISFDATIRLAGVDAAELSTDLGKDAKTFVSGLCPVYSVVTVVSHSLDKYGRVLATVLLPDTGTSLSDELIRHGFGVPYDGGPRGGVSDGNNPEERQ